MNPLRIGIDAHVVGERKTGNERYIINIVRALRRICRHDLVVYVGRPEAARLLPSGPDTAVEVLHSNNPVSRLLVELPLRACRDKLDVMLVQYTGPLWSPCPVVTVVHDVSFARQAELFSRLQLMLLRWSIPHTMRRAAAVLTVSNFSREEIAAVYGLGGELVVVAHDGVDPIFLADAAGDPPFQVPYVLSVGNLQPRKNLVTLVRAFAALLEAEPGTEHRLVIAGQGRFAAGELYREADALRRTGRVIFTGYVDDDRLVQLVHNATIFVHPSTYEGFGLPVLEAMASGVPVLASDIPVMREVAGEAAVLVAPNDVNAWRDALRRLLGDRSLRLQLAERGRRRSGDFTWDACATAVLRTLERAARR